MIPALDHKRIPNQAIVGCANPGSQVREDKVQDQPQQIPPIIHQIWIQGQNALPQRYVKASEQWQKRNPGWHYHFWDDQSLTKFLKEYQPHWLPLYECQQDLYARSDVARYALLEHYGGLYADMDTWCVRPVSRFVHTGAASLKVQIYSPSYKKSQFHPTRYDLVANSIIACTPGHPIWEQVREEIARRNDPVMTVPWRTGPDMFWPIVKQYSEDNPQQVEFVGRRNILTTFFLPRAYMHWYGWTRRKVCVLDFNDSGRAAVVRELIRICVHLRSSAA